MWFKKKEQPPALPPVREKVAQAPIDWEEVFRLYEQRSAACIGPLQLAAAEGHAEAAYRLGVVYGGCSDAPPDAEMCVFWFEKAHALGDKWAAGQLALLYSDMHQLLPLDWEKARAWAERGIEREDGFAACQRADMSSCGQGGVPASWSGYVAFMEKAVSFGYFEAAHRLAANYRKGIPEFLPGQGKVPKDPERALHWLAIAAAHIPEADAEWPEYEAEAAAARTNGGV